VRAARKQASRSDNTWTQMRPADAALVFIYS